MGPSLFFSLLVITVSFLPIFALRRKAAASSSPWPSPRPLPWPRPSLLAITLVPVMMLAFLRGKNPGGIPKSPEPADHAPSITPLLEAVLRFPKIAILVAVILVVVTIYPFSQLGSEFMPPLDEGDLLYMPTTMPGISITEAKNILQQTDRIIRTFPEVENVFGKAGRAETATDPAPL